MTFEELQQRYRQRYRESASLFEKALLLTPGGVHGNLRFYPPFPLSFDHGQGAYLIDVDGYRYIDYFLSYGSLMLGHGHPVVREAVERVWQVQGTSSFGAPHRLEIELADVLRNLYPSMESIRFTNSGLEATLLSIRLALAYTGKTHIAKFEGHYHGSHDHVLVSIQKGAHSGSASQPLAVPDSFGLPEYYTEHTVVLPFNEWEACERILTERKDEIGAVILEPMMGGYVPATPSFIKNLKLLTQSLGIVLIFDEVKTGFRVALGGAQEYYGVSPDLTALGKVVGGGFPIGVVGGRKEILGLCSPLQSGKPLFHSGTFNGNPVSLAAGLATIRFLSQPSCFDNIVNMTKLLRDGIETLAKQHGIPFTTIGAGTIFNLVDTGEGIGHDAVSTEKNRRRLALDYLLMETGVFSKPLNRFSMSAVHGKEEIERTLEAFDKSFAKLGDMIGNTV